MAEFSRRRWLLRMPKVLNIVNVGYRSANYYVLADTRPRLLVDAGWPGTLATMRQTSARKDIRLEDIPFQLVTHFHPDHAGLVEELKRLGIRLLLLDTQLAGIPLLRIRQAGRQLCRHYRGREYRLDGSKQPRFPARDWHRGRDH